MKDLDKIRDSMSKYENDIENPRENNKDEGEDDETTRKSDKLEKGKQREAKNKEATNDVGEDKNKYEDEIETKKLEKARKKAELKKRKEAIANKAKIKSANISFLQRNIQLIALLKKNGPYVSTVIIWVFFFLFFIELMPVFLKLIFPFGEYEQALLRRDKIREDKYKKEFKRRDSMKDYEETLMELVIARMVCLDEASITSADSVEKHRKRLKKLLEDPHARIVHDAIEKYLRKLWGVKTESTADPDPDPGNTKNTHANAHTTFSTVSAQTNVPVAKKQKGDRSVDNLDMELWKHRDWIPIFIGAFFIMLMIFAGAFGIGQMEIQTFSTVLALAFIVSSFYFAFPGDKSD